VRFGDPLPGALSIRTGAVPGWTRGSFQTAPTYTSRFPGIETSDGCGGFAFLVF
jgi:hypothetical protein